MINRVIDFPEKNKPIIFILVAIAFIWGWRSMKQVSLDAIPEGKDEGDRAMAAEDRRRREIVKEAYSNGVIVVWTFLQASFPMFLAGIQQGLASGCLTKPALEGLVRGDSRSAAGGRIKRETCEYYFQTANDYTYTKVDQ